MNTPQDRVIKKMIDNIVESNRPSFERPASTTAETPRVNVPSASHSAASTAEDGSMITRKLDYGFNSLRQENAELRKQLEELGGGIKMLRNDLDVVRQAVLRAASSGAPQGSPHRDAPTQPMTSAGGGSLGAPQYRKSDADEAFEKQGGSSEAPASSQARGFQKKEDAAAQVDINKVFYYGKK